MEWKCRIESIGVKTPGRILTTSELMGKFKTPCIKKFGLLTGISERKICSTGEDSFTLAAAAAVILDKSDNLKGFLMFRTYTFPEYSEELLSCSFYKKSGWFRIGRNILNIKQKESFLDVCVNCSLHSFFNFLDESGMALNEIDLIIPSQSPLGFTGILKKKLGLNGNFIELESTGEMVFHTAGPAFALKRVWDDKRFRNSKNIVFITIGSGINVSLALYRN
ncbi:MAG: hypothetical protein A2V46_11715 [Bacteroidetes bacterium RBG_19FT_COMBO_42_7]|nr:MAG: hypothetical protein A2V46_11715 [Bacteroidetes bacterium RBG_19FT_COMBO_42_7]